MGEIVTHLNVERWCRETMRYRFTAQGKFVSSARLRNQDNFFLKYKMCFSKNSQEFPELLRATFGVLTVFLPFRTLVSRCAIFLCVASLLALGAKMHSRHQLPQQCVNCIRALVRAYSNVLQGKKIFQLNTQRFGNRRIPAVVLNSK